MPETRLTQSATENASTITIANIAEAFLPLYQRAFPCGTLDERLEHELDLSQRSLFWGGSGSLLITPKAIPPELLQVAKDRLGYTNISTYVPPGPPPHICRNLINDQSALDKVRATIDSSPNVRVTSYSATSDYCALINLLQRDHPHFRVANIAGTDYSSGLVADLDSKVGFRKHSSEALTASGVFLPDALVCHDVPSIVSAAARLSDKYGGVVIKVHDGQSGWGLKSYTLRIGHRPHLRAWKRGIESLFERDRVWAAGPYIVEQLVKTAPVGRLRFPFVEGIVTEGGFDPLYCCDQFISKSGEFKGIIMGPDALPPKLASRLNDTTKLLGTHYFGLGYRGIFDIDFLIGSDDRVYALECNARITGGTHVYGLAYHLFGDDWMRFHCVSNEELPISASLTDVAAIINRLEPILYPIRRKPEGIAISSVSLGARLIGITAIGPQLNTCYSLIRRSMERLSS